MSTSDLTVGLIAGGAVVGGAMIGGLAQTAVAWRQRVHDRRERKRSQRVEVYRDALQLIYSIPGVFREGLPLDPANQKARVDAYASKVDLIRADLGMFAPRPIRELFNEVSDALFALRDWSTDPHPGGVYVDFQERFYKHVQPVARRLADAMAADADIR
jgi:hypothetical protein